jgi:membrane protease subunit HflK
MNWDWDKLQEKKQRQFGGGGGRGPSGPDFDEIGDKLKRLKGFKLPGGTKIIVLLLLILWLASGIYFVQPDEIGVVKRFGAFAYTTQPGPHYHLPFPFESAMKPKVTRIRRIEVGFRTPGRVTAYQPGQIREVPDEALMLTGDENIVSVHFIVQYKIKDPVDFLFNVYAQDETVKAAAEAAMRAVIGDNKIDTALTAGKFEIQNATKDYLQGILDKYGLGVEVVAVQLQDVHPPNEVVDAFKDVASAREDRSRIINEAEAYRNDILPKARGQAAVVVNAAKAYKESAILEANGEASRFLAVLEEYRKAPEITRKRLYIEAMEDILANPELKKLILSEDAAGRIVPYLPLDKLGGSGSTQRKKQQEGGN